jgi:hypothetical protein
VNSKRPPTVSKSRYFETTKPRATSRNGLFSRVERRRLARASIPVGVAAALSLRGEPANGHWGRWTPLRSVQLAGNSHRSCNSFRHLDPVLEGRQFLWLSRAPRKRAPRETNLVATGAAECQSGAAPRALGSMYPCVGLEVSVTPGPLNHDRGHVRGCAAARRQHFGGSPRTARCMMQLLRRSVEDDRPSQRAVLDEERLAGNPHRLQVFA